MNKLNNTFITREEKDAAIDVFERNLVELEELLNSGSLTQKIAAKILIRKWKKAIKILSI